MTPFSFSASSNEPPKIARRCFQTEKPFEPGEKAYSILLEENGELKRRDYCAAAWKSTPRPENALAWWTSRIPDGTEKKGKIAPNDVLTDLFESLADHPDQAAFRYALALLLTRRRVLRFEREEETNGEDSAPEIVVYSPRRETAYVVPVVAMNADEIADVQRRLVELLYEPTDSPADSVSNLPDAAPTKS